MIWHFLLYFWNISVMYHIITMKLHYVLIYCDEMTLSLYFFNISSMSHIIMMKLHYLLYFWNIGIMSHYYDEMTLCLTWGIVMKWNYVTYWSDVISSCVKYVSAMQWRFVLFCCDLCRMSDIIVMKLLKTYIAEMISNRTKIWWNEIKYYFVMISLNVDEFIVILHENELIQSSVEYLLFF